MTQCTMHGCDKEAIWQCTESNGGLIRKGEVMHCDRCKSSQVGYDMVYIRIAPDIEELNDKARLCRENLDDCYIDLKLTKVINF